MNRATCLDMQQGKGVERHPEGSMNCRIRMDILWDVREKGVKADKYDSVDGAEKGNSENSDEFNFGGVDGSMSAKWRFLLVGWAHKSRG